MIPSLLTDTITTDLDRAVHYALLWGLEGIELRSVGGPADRVPFVNESKLRHRLQESELAVVGVVPGIFEGETEDRSSWLNEIASLDETLQFCRRIACSRVIVSSFKTAGEEDTAAKALRLAGERAARYGIAICVINEAGMLASTGADLSRLIGSAGNVMAAWNPTAALESGEDPSDGLTAVAASVGLVRCRNGVNEGNGWEARSIDRGGIDWQDQVRRLAEQGFEGPISLEVTGEQPAKQGLHDATAMIQYIRVARRGK